MRVPHISRQTLYIIELTLIAGMIIGLGFTVYQVHKLNTEVTKVNKTIENLPSPSDPIGYDDMQRLVEDAVSSGLDSSDIQNQLEIISAKLGN